MTEFMGPTNLEGLMTDITTYMSTSSAPEKEKIRIMELVASYYEDRNLTEIDQILGQLARAAVRTSGQMEMFNETSE